jgi:hypothetical protein
MIISLMKEVMSSERPESAAPSPAISGFYRHRREEVAVDGQGFVRRVKTIARGLIGEMRRVTKLGRLGHD